MGDEAVRLVWNSCVGYYRRFGPLRFKRETILALDILPWLASLSTFSIVSILAFALYVCLLFMYPSTSSIASDNKKFSFNLMLFVLKTLTLVMYVSNENSFWLLSWLYFGSLTQILNSLRWRADSFFIFGRNGEKDEILTMLLPISQFFLIAITHARTALKAAPTPFWNLFALFQWFIFIGILFFLTVPLINFYLGDNATLQNNFHRNDLVFELHTAFCLFVGFYWVVTELLWVVVILGGIGFLSFVNIRDNNKELYAWLMNEDWVGKIYAHFEEQETVRKDKECVVCMENTVNTVIVPCGHICICLQCADKIKPLKCPICKTVAQNVVRTFDVTYKVE